MSTLRLLISDSYDPWFNLAVEECIFRQMPATQRVLFLWRNADTVVIGRAQNPWKECNTRRMEEDNVRLARRSSGGGAVFHDLGNTCFTFMAGKPEYDKTISTSIVLNALNALAIMGEKGLGYGLANLLMGDPRQQLGEVGHAGTYRRNAFRRQFLFIRIEIVCQAAEVGIE